MQNQNLSRVIVSLLLSFVVLGAVLFYVFISKKTDIANIFESSQIVFTTDDLTRKLHVPVVISDKGVLNLGKFVVVRLQTNTRAQIQEVIFDPARASVKTAVLKLEQGRIWLGNFALGQTIRISTGKLNITNYGGSLDVLVEEGSTQIIVSSGNAEITLTDDQTDAPFRAFILAGNGIKFDSTKISELIKHDATTRAQIWESFQLPNLTLEQDYLRDQLKQDSTLIATLTNTFLNTERQTFFQTIWKTLEKYLTILPSARQRYWLREITRLLSVATTKNAEIVAHELQTNFSGINASDIIKRQTLAKFIPFTRLVIMGSLPDRAKQTIGQLAKLELSATLFSDATPLALTIALTRMLNLATQFPNSADEYLKSFSEIAQNNIEKLNTNLLTQELDLYLKNNPNSSNNTLLATRQTFVEANTAKTKIVKNDITTSEPTKPKLRIVIPKIPKNEITSPIEAIKKIRRPMKILPLMIANDGKIARPTSAFE